MITIETDWDIRSRKKRLYLRTEGNHYVHIIEDAEAPDTWDRIRKFEQEFGEYDRRKIPDRWTYPSDFD